MLTGADAATVLRVRATLRRWGSGQTPSRPLAEATRDRLRTWHADEASAADANHRRPRYILQELATPPLALGWLASYQEDKFPGEAPVPNRFAVSVNHDADASTRPIPSDPTVRPEHTRDATIRWPPGLPRFWLSHRRRATPGGVGKALRRWSMIRTRTAWASVSSRPKQGAVGHCLADLHKGTLPLHLYAQVPLPSGAWGAHPAGDQGAIPAHHGSQHHNTTTRRTINLEGMVARLRGYTGGSFTQMTHHLRPFRIHVPEARARLERDTTEQPQDLIATLAECDHDLAEPTTSQATNSGAAPATTTQ